MSSIGSILSIARTAMQTQQLAMQTTGHNIANANTEGYSAQQVRMAAQVPQGFAYGYEGTGVTVRGITRARDVLLDQQYRTSFANQGQYSTTRDIMSRVESVFGEPSDSSLSSAMDAFWSSWSDLSANPTSDVARTAVRAKGQALATTFNAIDSHLNDVAASSRQSLTQGVTNANNLLHDIAQLNSAIVASESGNRDANDLRDQRDMKLDQLSQYVNLQTVDRGDGATAVYVGGRMLVDRDVVHTLTMSGSTTVTIGVTGDPTPIVNIGGSVGANANALTTLIPNMRASIDALAGAVVREVNVIHSGGQAYSGNPPVARAGGNFFLQNGAVGTGDRAQTAAGISLDPSVSSNITNIVASSGTAAGPGDNGVAKQLASLRETSLTLYDGSGAAVGTSSLNAFYRGAITDLGTGVSQADALASMHETVTSQAQARRESVSGVATDEELVALIKEQQAYAAAARLITVVDEMTKSLLAIGG